MYCVCRLCCSMYCFCRLCCSIIVFVDCVVLCIVFVDCVVLCIVFVDCVVLCTVFCKCVLYYCHRVSTQLQLNISYHIISYHIISYHIIYHIISYQVHTDVRVSSFQQRYGRGFHSSASRCPSFFLGLLDYSPSKRSARVPTDAMSHDRRKQSSRTDMPTGPFWYLFCRNKAGCDV